MDLIKFCVRWQQNLCCVSTFWAQKTGIAAGAVGYAVCDVPEDEAVRRCSGEDV